MWESLMASKLFYLNVHIKLQVYITTACSELYKVIYIYRRVSYVICCLTMQSAAAACS